MLRVALIVLFAASGTAALVYELVWFHLLTLVIGASALSIAALLASFMGGMALGSTLLPRVVPRHRHPLYVVAMLEVGIALAGLTVPIALPVVRSGYLTVASHEFIDVVFRAGVAALVLLPPTILMGATLPAVSRWMRSDRGGAADVGYLYMANIAGGAFGTVLAGFYLLRVHDTVVATGVAATLNLAAALLAWSLARRFAYHPAEEPGPGLESIDPAGGSRWPVYVVAAASGLTALGAEVVWTRQLSLLFGASVYTFSLILAVFLAGLGLGSLIGSTLLRRGWSAARALGWCQLLLVIAIGYGSYAIVNWLPDWQPTRDFLPEWRHSPGLRFGLDAVRTAVALLPATLLWGASFPLALAIASGGRDTARPVARVNAVNTLGSLAGTVLFTLVAIPLFGSQQAQQALAFVAAMAAGTMFWSARREGGAPGALAATVVALAAALWLVPPIPAQLIAYGRSVRSWDTIKEVLYLKEGATASVAVTEGSGGARQFHIAGKVEASDMDLDMRLERMLGHIPALVHPRPRSVLVVGVGAGVTAGTFVVHPEVERIVICEIEPAVPASAREFFSFANHAVFDDPRVEVVFDDARHFLQTTDEKFDIITSDPIHPWVRGAATLYSLEYLQLVRQHLNPDGVVTQWVPLYETDDASVKSEIATFAQVFPDTTLWNPDLLEEGYDLVALGRLSSTPIDEEAIDRRLRVTPELGASLQAVSLDSARALFATYAGRAPDLGPWMIDAEINRERHLRLQYLAGLAANADQPFSIFQGILSYRRYPADLLRVSTETEALLRDWFEGRGR